MAYAPLLLAAATAAATAAGSAAGKELGGYAARRTTQGIDSLSGRNPADYQRGRGARYRFSQVDNDDDYIDRMRQSL